MARTHQAYPPEFRRQMVELVKSGRTPSELAREYEPSEGSIRNWVAQSERDTGERSDGLSTGCMPWQEDSGTGGSRRTSSGARDGAGATLATSCWNCGGCGARTSSCAWSATS